MVRETSVVTPERYSEGLTFDQYMNTIKVNKARFEEYYANVQVGRRRRKRCRRWLPRTADHRA